MLFYETHTRTAVKTVLWRIVATLITWGTVYWFTGEIKESIKITLIAALLGMTAYYFYERIWNAIGWGKVIK